METENVFIDLSKCSEEQRKHIFSLLPKDDYKLDMQIVKNYKHLHLCKIGWFVDIKPASKTELTYPEFIKLFEGGEDYPGKRYQPLFDHLNSEHGLILHASEMDEIIRIVNVLNFNQ